MAKKDKFAQMKQGGGGSTFQDMVAQAKTVAAIEQQASMATIPTAEPASPQQAQEGQSSAAVQSAAPAQPTSSQQPATVSERLTHLPNPWISMREYNLASNYCNTFDNMTRMDWMELAIIEKLHRDGLLPEEEFQARRAEITTRPPRGLRKNTKVQKNK